MRWILKRSEAALVAAALLLGCDDRLAAPIDTAHGEDAPPRRGGALRLASLGDIKTLDPAVGSDFLGGSAIELLFAGLLDFDEHSNVVPDLASRYEVVDDGLTYRFFLREHVHFQSGEELTADDVRRSIERSLHPATPNPASTFFESIRGYDEYASGNAPSIEGVSVEGRYVVAIHLHERDARFLPAFALHFLRPVCPSGGARYADTWQPCGAGPFKLVPGGWDRGRSLTLVRNDDYFRPGLPHLDSVTWTYAMNPVTQRLRFEDGDLDLLRDLTQADATRFTSDPRWKPFGAYEPERAIGAESMNTELAPFDNVEIRRAVASAIDRNGYHELRPTNVIAATQLLAPAVPGYDPNLRCQSYDEAAALEHMRRAGYPFDPTTGKGGYPRPIDYYAYWQGFSYYSAQLLQQQLARIGLRLNIKLVSYATFLALTARRRRVQIAAPGWQEDYPDPADFFEPLFSTKSINDEQSFNFSFYSNPHLDELLDLARHELDRAHRFALYGEASRIVCDEAPWAFTNIIRYFEVHQPYVRGYEPHPLWSDYVANVWVDRPSGHAEQAAARPPLGGFAVLLSNGRGPLPRGRDPREGRRP